MMKMTDTSDLLPCSSCADSGFTPEGDFCECGEGDKMFRQEMRSIQREHEEEDLLLDNYMDDAEAWNSAYGSEY